MRKRIFLFVVLFINLQIILTEGNLSLCSSSISAQMHEVELNNVDVVAEAPLECSYCGQKYLRENEDAHIEACPEYPVTCEKCGAGGYTRSTIKNHTCPSTTPPDGGGGGGGGGVTPTPTPGPGGGGGGGNVNPSKPTPKPNKKNVNKQKLVSNFKKSVYNRKYIPKLCGWCLRAWKTIWQNSGIGEYDGTRFAKDFGPKLEAYGFSVIYSGKGNVPPDGYVPQIGDTRVWESYPGQKYNAGHIDWYDGEHWVSDFVQQSPWLPGSKYINSGYKVYR